MPDKALACKRSQADIAQLYVAIGSPRVRNTASAASNCQLALSYIICCCLTRVGDPASRPVLDNASHDVSRTGRMSHTAGHTNPRALYIVHEAGLPFTSLFVSRVGLLHCGADLCEVLSSREIQRCDDQYRPALPLIRLSRQVVQHHACVLMCLLR